MILEPPNPPAKIKSLSVSIVSPSAAATAAKLLQSCLTLCDPIDCSPPGSPIPGILQARTLEWVAISFSNAWKWKVKVKSLSRVWLLATPWTAAYQAPLSMEFSRQKYWSGVPLPSLNQYHILAGLSNKYILSQFYSVDVHDQGVSIFGFSGFSPWLIGGSLCVCVCVCVCVYVYM